MKKILSIISLAALTIGLLGSCKKDNGPTPKLPEGALSGKFTVNAEGKQVYFSKGNLVATINASGAPTAWKFAENQYDYLGEGGANKTIGVEAGDVDLFGWSTPSTTYGISTSSVLTDYVGDFKDWGTAIDDKGTWRTLSTNEWAYLVNTRTVNGGTGKDKSYSPNIIYGGKKGSVLYPDNYAGSVLSGTVETLPEGVVFFPNAGYRDGSTVGQVGQCGSYWSSTAHNELSSDYLAFDNNGYAQPDYYSSRQYGYSVRLVTEVK